ncbi:MAG: hypothetical protein ABFC28_08900 [Rikenellaceae bacterium]
MKKLLVLFVLVLLMGCKKEPQPTVLNLAITQQPTGGYNVETVSATFTGSITGDIVPVVVTIEWWWENGYHTDQKMKSTNNYTFSSATMNAFTTSWAASAGYYHLNYFWIKIKWTDANGAHVMESNKAYCDAS